MNSPNDCTECKGSGIAPDSPMKKALQAAYEVYEEKFPNRNFRIPWTRLVEPMILAALRTYIAEEEATPRNGRVYEVEPPQDSSRLYRDAEGDFWKWAEKEGGWVMRSREGGFWSTPDPWDQVSLRPHWLPFTDVTNDPKVFEWVRE